ncbi:MAG: hypothetical protein ACOX1O_07475 [Eggerthellaceae bacterium]
MARLLIVFLIIILIMVGFALGQKHEQSKLVDLEPDEAHSEKWEARTKQSRAEADTAADDDVIDVPPENIDQL